jgi:hypothetical protein
MCMSVCGPFFVATLRWHVNSSSWPQSRWQIDPVAWVVVTVAIAVTRTFTVRNEKLSCTGISLDRLCANCLHILAFSISRWSCCPGSSVDPCRKWQSVKLCWWWRFHEGDGLSENRKAKLFLCLTNWALRHKDVWGSGYIDKCFLDTCWKWVVSFTPRRFTPCTHCIGHTVA